MSDNEVLVVQSKIKKYIKDKSGMSTSGAVAKHLSGLIAKMCDEAMDTASAAKRKTVMDRDFGGHDA
ncbi:MAG: histone H3/H4 [Myxococcota bacterium]|jgi:histone H3/H4